MTAEVSYLRTLGKLARTGKRASRAVRSFSKCCAVGSKLKLMASGEAAVRMPSIKFSRNFVDELER